MTHEELSELTVLELLELHNALRPEDPLNTWRSKPAKLVDRIMAIPGVHDIKPPAKTFPEDTSGSLKAYACALLCTVDYYEHAADDSEVSALHPRARSVGIPYPKILELVVARFPDANTSVASLRWYCVQIASDNHQFEGYVLPSRRPRKRRETPARKREALPSRQDHYTSTEAAEALGLSMDAFYAKRSKGRLPEPLKVNGQLFFKKSEIESSGLCSV